MTGVPKPLCIWGVRVLIERMDCRERWATSRPLTWSEARAEAERHERAGRKARVVEFGSEAEAS